MQCALCALCQNWFPLTTFVTNSSPRVEVPRDPLRKLSRNFKGSRLSAQLLLYRFGWMARIQKIKIEDDSGDKILDYQQQIFIKSKVAHGHPYLWCWVYLKLWLLSMGKVVGRGETCLSFHNVTLRHRSLRENCLFIAILSTAGQQASKPAWLALCK